MKKKIFKALKKLEEWRIKNGWKGHDPFGIRHRLYEMEGQCEKAIELQKEISRLETVYSFEKPELFHALLKDTGYYDPKTFANFGKGYIYLYKQNGNDDYLKTAVECGDWLVNDSDNNRLAAWGHPFVWYTEVNRYFHKKNNPNIYITSLVVHFLLDLYEVSGVEKYLAKAHEGIHYLSGLSYYENSGGICFWYIIDRKELKIHNGNVFVASVLLRSEEKEKMDLAEKALGYTLNDQNRDGSWYYYGPPRNDQMGFIDNYHTGFILEALYYANRTLMRGDIERAIKRGAGFYKKMYSENGEPYRWSDRPFPQDIHDAAQGIATFLLLKDLDPDCLGLGKRIAAWAIDEMQDEAGHFYYRKLTEERVVKFPYMRWSQAPMFKALAILYLTLSST